MTTRETRTPDARADAREREGAAALAAVVEDLGAELSLRPLLERILDRSITLLGGDAGSICLVDELAGVYRKEADIGVACQSGRVFPLTEGVTGAVVARRGTVIFRDYAEVPGGHVPEADRATLQAVIGVPIWWRTASSAPASSSAATPTACSAPRTRELLELFATHAALAITYARLHESAEANARAEAAAEERNRMAREVHDTVAKGLVSVLLQLRSAEANLAPGARPTSASRSARPGAAASFALEETRRSVLGLAPSPLAGRSLEEALERELAWANRTGAADVRLVVAGEPVPLRTEVAHALFRIAQEALPTPSTTPRPLGPHRHRLRPGRGDPAGAGRRSRIRPRRGGAGRRPARHRPARDGRAGPPDGRHPPGRVHPRLGHAASARHLPHGEDAPSGPAVARVRLLIADDHEAIGVGIARLLADVEPSIEVVGQAGSGREALLLWRALRPDVVLMDLRMPDGDGVEAIVRIRAEDPEAAIVALTAFDHDELVAGALRAGARGATWARTPPAPTWPARCSPRPTAARSCRATR